MNLRPFAIAALAVVAVLTPTAALAVDADPGSGQTLDEGQTVATDAVVLGEGHVDLGPHFVDGSWTLMVHDDTAEPSTWRHFDKTVIRVSDSAILTVPDDEAYAFIGARPGSDVHVMPQTQTAGVVWMGWNTQDPTVMESIDRGVTLGLGRIEGPGDVLVYLQSGSFDAPDVLWDSRETDEQPVWVDVNTHTHANWVFTRPGVYLVEATVGADLVDGSTVSDTRVIRFAVGDSTNTGDALAAHLEPVVAAADPVEAEEAVEPSDDPGLVTVLAAMIAVVVIALAAAVAIVVVRAGRAKKRALAARSDA